MAPLVSTDGRCDRWFDVTARALYLGGATEGAAESGGAAEDELGLRGSITPQAGPSTSDPSTGDLARSLGAGCLWEALSYILGGDNVRDLHLTLLSEGVPPALRLQSIFKTIERARILLKVVLDFYLVCFR